MTTAQQLNKSIITLNKRLTEIMRKRSITISQLSEKSKVAVGTIQKLMNDPTCNPTIGSLEAISSTLGVTISELIGEDQKLDDLLGKSICILSLDDIPNDLNNLTASIAEASSSAEFIKTFTKLSEGAFALRMEDDSMSPIFHKDCVLVFDPAKTVYNNCFVLVKLHNYRNLVFKQLIIDEPNQYIKSVNPLLKDNIIKLEPLDKIFATLVEAKIPY